MVCLILRAYFRHLPRALGGARFVPLLARCEARWQPMLQSLISTDRQTPA
jgi:hypothetical protein